MCAYRPIKSGYFSIFQSKVILLFVLTLAITIAEHPRQVLAQDEITIDEEEADVEAEIEAEIEAEDAVQKPNPKKQTTKKPKEQTTEEIRAEAAHEEEFNEDDFSDEDFADEQSGEPPAEEMAQEKVEEAPGEATEEGLIELEESDALQAAEPEPEPEAPKIKQPSEVASSDYWSNEPVPDNPNLEYEAKLHNIFLDFYNTTISNEEWKTLVGGRSAEKYQIQSGDTLWDISATLFGDGNYWPKVWSVNSDIRNPHLISPNNSIRFLLGDESEPPAFTVTENFSANEEAEPLEPVAQAEEDLDVEIPPPTKVSRPVVKKLPPSLPEWQTAGSRDKFDDLGIDYAKRKIIDVRDEVPLISFISEQDTESIGRIREIEIGNSIASTYQYIYVTVKQGFGQVGKTYLALANRGEVEQPHKSIKGKLGYSIDVLGEVQLIEKLDGKDESANGEMFRALVLNVVNPVSVGAALVEGKIENILVSEDGPRSQVVAQIIGGSYFNKRQVYGAESITYLNRGENDGLRVGQILPVRANRKVRNEDTLIESNVRPVGWLRVVKTTPRFATAIVVKAWSDIMAGDLTGSGGMQMQKNVAQPMSDESDSEDVDLGSELE